MSGFGTPKYSTKDGAPPPIKKKPKINPEPKESGFLGGGDQTVEGYLAQGTKDVFSFKKDRQLVSNFGTDVYNMVERAGGDLYDYYTGDPNVRSASGNAKRKLRPRKQTKPAPPNPNYADTADNLNATTQTSVIEPMYGDLQPSMRYPVEPGQPDEQWVTGETAPYSLFNEWSLFKWRGAPRSSDPNIKAYNSAWGFMTGKRVDALPPAPGDENIQASLAELTQEQIDAALAQSEPNIIKDIIARSKVLEAAANVPTGEVVDYNQFRNPSVSLIIDTVNNGDGASEAYRYSYFDFALCRYTGKISNDYMLTLRRFPMPVEDDITRPQDVDGKEKTKSAIPAMAQAVTWMSEATENKLEDILKFKVGLGWTEVESKLQELSGGGGSGGGKAGETIKNSNILSAIYGSATGQTAGQTKAQQEGWDPAGDTYPNHIYGPINAIKKVAVREQGLEFTQEFEINFHYNLRQIKGANPRAAFLDLMANLLVLTYNNGKFWGGAVRRTGGASGMNAPFGDQSLLQSGDWIGFGKSLISDFLQGARNVVTDLFTMDPSSLFGFSMNLGDSNLINNFMGGQMMDMFGTPQGGQAAEALLVGNATGEWHLTVGNPLNPIAVIGNLYCESAEFKFGGEMSYDGFPTELTLQVSLKHARPRDKADIESMFNGGKGRMYLTPEGGVDVGAGAAIISQYGNRDKAGDFTAVKRMTNG